MGNWSPIMTAILLCCLGAPAAAQRAPDASAQQPAQAKRDLAKSYYQLGAKLYVAKSYREALEQFDKAYRLTGLPELLYNIARCYEMLGRTADAIEHYERYLSDVPDAKHRATVEGRIRELRQQLQDSQTPAPASQPTASPAVEAEGTAPPAPPPPPSDQGWGWKKTAGWIAVGVGGASLVTGIIFGALASGKSSDYEAAVDDQRTYAELEQIRSDGESLQAAQIATLVIGGVLAAAGGGLLLWDRLGDERRGDARASSAALLPRLTRDSIGLAARLRF